MDIKDEFWNVFTRMKNDEFYYQSYRNKAIRNKKIFNILCLIFSIGPILEWASFNYIPKEIIVILILASSAISSFQPSFHFSKQLESTKYFLPALQNLLVKMAADWRRLDDKSDKEISALITKYEMQYNKLDQQFLDSDVFMPNKSCVKYAETQYKLFFWRQYGVSLGDVEYAGQK